MTGKRKLKRKVCEALERYARPAVILDLPLGKGGIAFCGLHVTHRDRYGGPGNEQRHAHTAFEKTLTANWLKWSGL